MNGSQPQSMTLSMHTMPDGTKNGKTDILMYNILTSVSEAKQKFSTKMEKVHSNPSVWQTERVIFSLFSFIFCLFRAFRLFV